MTGLLAVEPALGWNLVDDVRQLFEFPFMVNAYRAGTIAAIVAGAVGWFMVLRRQAFAGHTLAVIGFPGAAGAVLLGVSVQLGFFTFCIGGALVIASLSTRTGDTFREESALIAIVQTSALACGFLFSSLYRGNLSRVNSLLFGTFLGISSAQVALLAVVGIAALVALALCGRTLLFASVDPGVATAAGVPTRALSFAFLVVLGVAAAAASQITGSLLIFALLVLPPATAQSLTARPVAGVLVSVALALAVTWLGLAAAYYSSYPIGFWITSIAFALFLLGRIRRPWPGWHAVRRRTTA